MLARYSTNENGKTVKIADIYTVAEHGVTADSIDSNALKIIERLRSAGFQAYIVGGAVRDLLLGKHPKDFDIATDARPRKIRKLFRHSRIIGRRFQIVHVYFGKERFYEVSTFRSLDSGVHNNIFGTIDEDVQRRDFTLNALYYAPKEQYIIDHVNAMKDIREKVVRSIIPLNVTFLEDPVRMIRAIKYAEKSGFNLSFRLGWAIKRHAPEIEKCSISRLTEEIFKIMSSGKSAEIVKTLFKMNLLKWILPSLWGAFTGSQGRKFQDLFFQLLRTFDRKVRKKGEEVKKSRMIAVLAEVYLDMNGMWNPELFLSVDDVVGEIKQFIKGMAPPNIEVTKAARYVAHKQGVKLHRKRREV